MPHYNVIIPCTMAVCVTVEAENEEAAKEAAFDVPWNLDIKSDSDASPDIVEMDCHSEIVTGNVYHGCINEMYVEEA